MAQQRGPAQELGPISDTIPEAGRRLAAIIDGMDVLHLWIAKYHVDWRTGVATGPRETNAGGHTHCSAFIAALADRLGIYLLHPPEHGQDWLADAQSVWLNSEPGRAARWVNLGRLADPEASRHAVHQANAGYLVIAIYNQPPHETPQGPQPRSGHAAIVRPSDKPAASIDSEGPDVAQAGRHNHDSIPLRRGFADHPQGLIDGTIEYFAHPTDLSA